MTLNLIVQCNDQSYFGLYDPSINYVCVFVYVVVNVA